ncbi:MAG: hypothetical protein ACRDPD_04390 [Streptosporangiaceae bacterium]
MHRLAERGRQISGSVSLWSIWRNDQDNTLGTAEHHDPFASRLGNLIPLHEWVNWSQAVALRNGRPRQGAHLPAFTPLPAGAGSLCRPGRSMCARGQNGRYRNLNRDRHGRPCHARRVICLSRQNG